MSSIASEAILSATTGISPSKSQAQSLQITTAVECVLDEQFRSQENDDNTTDAEDAVIVHCANSGCAVWWSSGVRGMAAIIEGLIMEGVEDKPIELKFKIAQIEFRVGIAN